MSGAGERDDPAPRPAREWCSAGPEPRSSDVKLSLLRSTIMNPFVRSPTPEGDYIDKFVRALPEILDRVYGEWKSGVALES